MIIFIALHYEIFLDMDSIGKLKIPFGISLFLLFSLARVLSFQKNSFQSNEYASLSDGFVIHI